MGLDAAQRVNLEAVIKVGYGGSMSDRAGIVLAWDEGESAASIAQRFGTSRPTVYKWVRRFDEGGLDALVDRVSTGRPRSVSARDRSRIVALTRMSPPDEVGLSHWSTYEMAKYLRRVERIEVSPSFVATVWREAGLQPHRQGTFKLSKDPQFCAKVRDHRRPVPGSATGGRGAQFR